MTTRAALAIGIGLALASGCAIVQPADVPTVAPGTVNDAVARDYPGAANVLAGFDVSGERALRDGDGVLYGIELVRGETVTRRLLRVEVALDHPLARRALVTFSRPDCATQIPPRVARGLHLVFTLLDADGKELERSQSPMTVDYYLTESFVAGITSTAVSVRGIASARLLEVIKLLQGDPVLKKLLAEAAAVPFDLRLLFRRDLLLEPAFDQGKTATLAGALAALPNAHELPFDLRLNDSLFVRLSATVVEPHGPTGAVAGIALLRAQQATDPSRQVRLQLLATARGPQSDWQRHGVVCTTGAVDEGVALAFSPDGRWVAMPGARGVVELRDLHAVDPTSTRRLLGADGMVGGLVFLDDSTLLVGRGAAVEVFAIAGDGAELQPAATIKTALPVAAIEMSERRTCFVGSCGSEVQRWEFGSDLARPVMETVCAAEPITGKLGDGSAAMPVYVYPPVAFLVAGADRDRVVVHHGATFAKDSWRDFEHRRVGDGTWERRELAPLAASASPRERWRGSDPPLLMPTGVQKGGGHTQSLDGKARFFAGGVLLLERHGQWLMLGTGHGDSDAIVHGFDPSGRFFAFVAPGLRLLLDVERVVPSQDGKR